MAQCEPDKRHVIIEAAVQVFAEKGYRQARVCDIAGRAGVADGTIYLYFKNKEDLLLSLFEEKMGELLDGLLAKIETVDDPIERIRLFAHYHFSQVREKRAVAEVLQIEIRLSNKFLKEYRPHKLWDYIGVLGEAIREGQRLGLFRPELDPFILMWALFGSLDELGMQWILSAQRERFSIEEAAGQVAETFIRGMLLVCPGLPQPKEAP